MKQKTIINQQGRVTIPAECRQVAGMQPGVEVTIGVMRKGELRLRTKSRAIGRAQEIVGRGSAQGRDLAAELIAERRKEAARG
jgi:bifunctional DNA-binding transcriptional regulator/antitoxin component of YhaV-PrlF toxin-antitoxin module